MEKVYVIYDRNDFVKCVGTASELVKRGFFKNQNEVYHFISWCRQTGKKDFSYYDGG